jgi:hypothetical protein
MTKLVVVLAVVVLVILVVVIVAVRNMRTEDPDEFTDQQDGRARTRGSQDDRDLGNRRGEPAGRQPARAGRGARPAGGAASGRSPAGRQGNGHRPPSTGRDFDERRNQPPGRGYGRAQEARDGRGYDADEGFDQGGTRPFDDRPSAAAASGPQKRRRPGSSTQHPDDAPVPARTRRRSGDSSEWDSSEWEKLSDVDYWAELAAQKPLTTTTAQPAAPRPATQRGGAAAGPGQDLEPETLAARNSVPGGVPRRDPVTGLPVRGPQPAAAGLAAAAGRTDFVPAPVPGAGAQDHQHLPAASNGDRGSDHRRPPASRNGDRGRASRQRPPAPSAGEPGQRFLDAPGRDPGRYLDVGPASLPMPAIRDVPPARQGRPRDLPPAEPAAVAPPAARTPPARRERPRVPLDDDPLTSPSFPKVPTSDSRSYRNGRADTPPGGSRAPAQYPAATPQFPRYDSPAAQYPAVQYPTAQYPTAQYPQAQYPQAQYPEAQYPEAQYPEAQYPEAQYPTAQYPTAQPPAARSGQHSAPQNSAAQHSAPQRPAPERPAAQHSAPQYPGDEDRSNPGAYRPDPLASRNPYPARAANGSPGPVSTPPGPASTPPGRGPAAPAASNPYGSYVTSDSQQTVASGYNGYPATPGNGHGQPYLPPAVPGGTGRSGNDYWQQAAPTSGSLPEPGGPSYPQAPAQADDPRPADLHEPDYQNGYGRHGQADYPPNGYPAGPDDPAGYAPVDPYGSDGYGGYPEYGAAGR